MRENQVKGDLHLSAGKMKEGSGAEMELDILFDLRYLDLQGIGLFLVF